MADKFEMRVRSILQVLHDGHLGLAEIGHRLKNQDAKDFFLKESLTRQQFAGELEAELHRHGVSDVREGGTSVGAVQRAWGELKAHLGGSDHTLLATAEEGEDDTKETYRKALEEPGLPLPLKELLATQQEHLLQAHDRIKSLRDAQAA